MKKVCKKFWFLNNYYYIEFNIIVILNKNLITHAIVTTSLIYFCQTLFYYQIQYIELPFSDSYSSHQISRSIILLTCEVGLSVGELVNFGFEVNVCCIHHDICVKLPCCEPRSSEVTRKIAPWFNQLTAIHNWKSLHVCKYTGILFYCTKCMGTMIITNGVDFLNLKMGN